MCSSIGARLQLAVDDTLAQKKGRKVYGAGMHHDALLSTRRKAIVNGDHSWVRLGLAPLRVLSDQEQITQIPGHAHAKQETLESLLQTLQLAA